MEYNTENFKEWGGGVEILDAIFSALSFFFFKFTKEKSGQIFKERRRDICTATFLQYYL